MKYPLTLLLLVLLLSGPAYADEPLRPPHLYTFCSSSGEFCATSDPLKDSTTVAAAASGEVLWSIPGWHRWLFIANDGQSLVVGYNGMNLVPLDISLEESVLSFYSRGKLMRQVALGDLYSSKSQLQRTVSHFAWAHIPGFNEHCELIVELVDGRTVAFSGKNGQQVKVRANGT